METYPQLFQVCREVLSLLEHRYVVVFALLFREQLEPAILGRLDDLGDAERHGAHEVVPRRPVPVPHLHEQTAVLIIGLEITRGGKVRTQLWRNMPLGGVLGCFPILYDCVHTAHMLFVRNVILLNEYGFSLHGKFLIPDRIKVGLDGLGLLLVRVPANVRDELHLDVGVAEAVGVHRYQVLGLYHCKKEN